MVSRFNCLSEVTTLVNWLKNMESFQLFVTVYWSLELCKLNLVEWIVRFCSFLIDHLIQFFYIMFFCKKMWNLEGVALLWLGLTIFVVSQSLLVDYSQKLRGFVGSQISVYNKYSP